MSDQFKEFWARYNFLLQVLSDDLTLQDPFNIYKKNCIFDFFTYCLAFSKNDSMLSAFCYYKMKDIKIKSKFLNEDFKNTLDTYFELIVK